jgi:hypothetical protein
LFMVGGWLAEAGQPFPFVKYASYTWIHFRAASVSRH